MEEQFKNGVLAMAFKINFGTISFSGIIFNGNEFNQTLIVDDLIYAEEIGFRPKCCNSVKSVIEHEIGHLLDYKLKISNSPEYKKLMKYYTVNQVKTFLSAYSVEDNKISNEEVVAEAYAEFCNNPNPGVIAKSIWGLIEKKYMKKYQKCI